VKLSHELRFKYLSSENLTDINLNIEQKVSMTSSSSCCYSSLRLLLSLSGLLLLCTGVLLTGLGTWLLISELLFLGSGPDQLPLLTYCLLFIGFSVFLLAILSFCGAATKSSCMLGTFSTLLLGLLISQLAMASIIYFKNIDYRPVLREAIHELVKEKYHMNNTATTFLWDTIQQEGQCCGATGPIDWALSFYSGNPENTKEIGIGASATVLPFTIPSSCCRRTEDPLCAGTIIPKIRTIIDENVYYTEGCFKRAVLFVSSHQLHMIVAGAVIIFIEFCGILLSTCLCCAFRRIDDIKP